MTDSSNEKARSGSLGARLSCSALVLLLFIFSGCADLHNKGGNSNQPAGNENSNAAANSKSDASANGADRVEGSLTVNGNAASFKHVYAWTTKGAFDETKQDIKVLLTDQPVDEKDLGGIGLMSGSGKQGVELRIDSDKKIIGGEVYHSALKHGYFSSSGSHVFEPVVFDSNFVEGKVRSDGPRETFGDKWEYSASFKVKVRPGK
jgi:hypothetical protein